MEIPAEQFETLTKIPIVIYFGDNIPEKHSDHPSSDYWYATREMAFEFAKRINARGGHCTVVSLPEEGFKGNTHFIMSDTNNRSVAELVSRWLGKKRILDKFLEISSGQSPYHELQIESIHIMHSKK